VALGPHEVDPKKGSLHVTNGSAFLGIHPRRAGLLLNIVTSDELRSERIRKAEPISRGRWHNEVLVQAPDEVDDELRRWLTQAYQRTAT
jgi:hypothetical protein